MLNFFDFEVFKNLWTVTIINPISGEETVIVNDKEKLEAHYKAHKNEIYVGFNNRQYDNYVFKAILCGFNAWDINQWMIKEKRKGWEFSSLLRKVPLNSFDCMVGFNGLKTLEAFMGMSIRETTIPFEYDGEFTPEMISEVLAYNHHDVMATIQVFLERKSEFDSYMGLIKLFDLPLSYLSKSKAQLAATILGAKKTRHKDDFDVSIPPTLKLTKYRKVIEFFMNEWDYDTDLEIEIAGVPHKYGTGGIHGAVPNYFGEGDFLHIDVGSYYPSLMIAYPEYCMSRTGASLTKFRNIRDQRLVYKSQKNPMADALKIVINSTYGAMKDPMNPLYDPRSANNVCIFGQLLLTDLIEKLEGHCDLIQSNTDGLIVKLRGNYEEVCEICHEWENRTGMGLSYDRITKICQADVNTYVAVFDNGKIEAKGGYVKKLSSLDNDLPIVNEAIKNFLLNNVPVETTIRSCNSLIKFQKVYKLSGNYEFVMHNGVKSVDKCYRVFASSHVSDTYLGKSKGEGRTVEKFASCPDHCKVVNDEIVGLPCPAWLDKSWYVNLAKTRLVEKFGFDPREV